MIKFILPSLTAMVFLSGCLSPRQQCASDAKLPYRLAMNDRAPIVQNLERGYAVHKQQVPYSYEGQCQDKNLNYYTCMVNSSRTQETPVPINMRREEAKLKKLDAKIDLILKRERRKIAECALLPNE